MRVEAYAGCRVSIDGFDVTHFSNDEARRDIDKVRERHLRIARTHA
jgi:hypothetical protein